VGRRQKRRVEIVRLVPCATIEKAELSSHQLRGRGSLLKKIHVQMAVLGLGLAFLFAGALPGQSGQEGAHWTLEGVLAMMDKSAADFRSLTANLEHTKYTAVVQDTSTETGQIYVRRDQKMRIDIITPDPRTILRTGDSLFVFTPKINRVEEYDLGKNRSMVDQYVLLGFGTKSQSLLSSYTVALNGEEEMDGHKTLVLDLTPKSEEIRRQITKIQMWIDSASWLPFQQKFYEAGSGDYFQFHYSSMMKNLKINDSKFKPDWPKNANRVKPRD
jgi:outer membrane lipoprotein-sorting protein